MQVYFTVNVGKTQAGVHLIEGVHLIWGPLNSGIVRRFGGGSGH